jgi:two-component system OmpR family response regulator
LYQVKLLTQFVTNFVTRLWLIRFLLNDMTDTIPHILVVDDARDIRDPLVRYLQKNAYRATAVDGSASARKLLKSRRFDLAIVDIVMPGEDGLSFCRYLRESGDTPVLFLSGKTDDVDRIIGIEVGADDYMVKPFNPRELLARIGAILRRVNALPPRLKAKVAPRVRFDRWILDGVKRELFDDHGVGTPLSAGEFALLSVFVERPKIVLKREDLLDLTNGRDALPYDRSIDNAIMRLRRKLEVQPRCPQIIKTVWGGGYVFSAEPVTL